MYDFTKGILRPFIKWNDPRDRVGRVYIVMKTIDVRDPQPFSTTTEVYDGGQDYAWDYAPIVVSVEKLVKMDGSSDMILRGCYIRNVPMKKYNHIAVFRTIENIVKYVGRYYGLWDAMHRNHKDDRLRFTTVEERKKMVEKSSHDLMMKMNVRKEKLRQLRKK